MAKTKRPSIDALLKAADWLDYYSPVPMEDQKCREVANWLRLKARQRLLAGTCKEAGVSTAQVRREIARICKEAGVDDPYAA